MKVLPLVPLKDMVLYPYIVAPLFVSRKLSINAILSVQNAEPERVLFVAQSNQDSNNPVEEDLYKIGVIAKIIQVIKLPNDTLKVLVEAEQRVKISAITYNQEYINASYEYLNDDPIHDLAEVGSLGKDLVSIFTQYVKSNKKINPEVLKSITSENPSYTSNIIASHIKVKIEMKQTILETINIKNRIVDLIEIIKNEEKLNELDNVIHARVKKQMEKIQKDYYLQEQMKAIQKELSESSEDKGDLREIEDKINKLKLPEEAKTKAEKEYKKLKMMNPMQAESSVVRGYLDVLLGLPWNKNTKSKLNIKKASQILDRDHYGLSKVKDRILEYLSILQRSKKVKGPILCFVGPPGVGKTSLVKSIAESLGRKYVKFALGGVRDEAEIRGHRKTYIGSMPGKIISLIKKSETNNPVMLLDEIDKMSMDYRGDPASALLEVLDPEQNKHFSDHYLEVEYDLSDIVFVATANSLDIPRALLDRMEIIRISGYIENEKVQIAKNYLISKQMEIHNIKKGEINIEDSVILDMIRYYTKESGVRALDREISSLIRKCLKKILESEDIKTINVNSDNLESYLGTKKFRFQEAEKVNQVGVTTGLAYTEVGGELLSIESLSLPGKGEIKGTGKLGEVMKESVQAAYSYFKSKAKGYNVNSDSYKNYDVHMHVPEGAVPKDGPSAGIAIFTTLTSLMTQIPVKSSVAMTGEITLRGKVLPIGGLREKLLAALRGGIKTVIIPSDNERDLKDIPDDLKNGLEIKMVSNADEVLDIALERNISSTNYV